MQQDDMEEKENSSKEQPQLKGSDLIDDFIEKNRGKQRFEISDIDEKDFVSPEFSDEEEEVYTESMVNIYIKQGRYQQALEILRKICLNNPKKSSNFASQINLLEIITNNKIGV
jgi:tetratricopeptide (TPR) repeat protein